MMLMGGCCHLCLGVGEYETEGGIGIFDFWKDDEDDAPPHSDFRTPRKSVRKRAECLALARSAKAKHEVSDPLGF